MNKLVFSILFLAILFGGSKQSKGQNKSITFLVASDMGRHGKSEQKNIAGIMGRFAEENKIDFMAVAGDPIHDNGVKCVEDKEWKVKIEDIYTTQSLHDLPWYVVSGNHEYNGSVQAILDYSRVSGRWNAQARYYAMEFPVGKRKKILFVFIDTTPLIDKYRIDEPRSDAPEQNMEQQLRWLDSVLAKSDVRWKIVIGHHPVYAKTYKEMSERTDIQERVGKILENRGADLYICGHIHNFQHIKPERSKVHYVVNSSASQSRVVHEIDEVKGVLFSNPDPGYSVFTLSKDTLHFNFINHTGENIYSYMISKKEGCK